MIISGVVISSFTEVLFDLSGLICALLSTMSTALLSVYAKKVSFLGVRLKNPDLTDPHFLITQCNN